MSQVQSTIVLFLLLAISTPLRAQSESPYLGSLSCTAAACHGRTSARFDRGDRSGDEYAVWARHDPHASSGTLLGSTQYRDVLARYSATADTATARELRAAKCAGCHDPLGIQAIRVAGSTERVDPIALAAIGRGIGCESCHGPSREWIGRHAEPGITRGTLDALGMRATKPLDARAQLCASCHVGGEDADMNHDMLAAGHSELAFEFGASHAQLPKHWRSAEERLATRDFEAHAWLAGQIASSNAAEQLHTSRAARAATDPNREPWPEFSEWSCLACHQPLRGSARSSPISSDLPELLAGRTVPANSGWHTTFFNRKRTRHGMVEPDSVEPRTILAWIRSSDTDHPTWEQVCQQLLALSAVERCFDDELRIRAHLKLMSPTEMNRGLADASEDRALAQRIRGSLAFDAGRRVPRALLDPAPTGERSAARNLPFRWSELPDMMTILVDRWEQRFQRLIPRTHAP